MGIVIFDVDGVITDGTVIVDDNGIQSKRVNLKDIDAIFALHCKGILIGAVTAEKNSFSEWIRKKFPWDVFYDGVKNKGDIIEEIRSKGYEYIIYVGDGIKDISAFQHADFRICPKDAIKEIKVSADYIMEEKAGSGQLWNLIQIVDSQLKSGDQNERSDWFEHLNEHYLLIRKMMNDEKYHTAVKEAAEIISQAITNKKRIVIFGNGGSAADAQHIAAEFMGRFRKERMALDVEALTANTSLLTAIGNDYSYEDIFSRQIEGIIREGDVAIGISTSGKSVNVRRALEQAKAMGGKTILMASECVDNTDYDITLKVRSDNTARIQEVHILTGHYWADYVEKAICGGEQH